MASPRTNLDAPSIEPKKSASCATSARRCLASSCLMRPAFRSASMAICLPGIESKAKRAETSATRPEPLVITTKLMMVIKMKMTTPTVKLPPMRNLPKASITLPAASVPEWPSNNTMREEATFSDKRMSVVTSNRVGKDTKSLKFLMFRAAINTMMAMPMLSVNNMSKSSGGRGTSIITRMSKTMTGTAA